MSFVCGRRTRLAVSARVWRPPAVVEIVIYIYSMGVVYQASCSRREVREYE